jgi:hypothetical protein
MLFRRKLVCSFCGKSAAQVAKLVAGHGAYICDTCTAEALRLMADSDGPPRASEVTQRKGRSLADLWRRLVRRNARVDDESMSMKPA